MAARPRSVQIIGVPTDLGANIRGANMGPASIRIADLHQKIAVLGFEVVDAGDVDVPIRDTLPETSHKAKFRQEIGKVAADVQGRVVAALEGGHLPIILGGDHCIAIGSISGTSAYHHARGEKIGLIWIDAHADMNTPESSPSGNIHGMPLSIVLGNGFPELTSLGGFAPKVLPENVALLGIRTLDGGEKEILRKSGIRYFTMREIDERGMAACMKEAVQVTTSGTAGVHLSIDMDGIDPEYAPGVSTPVTGGLSFREAHLALEMIADTGKLRAMEFVELNPMTDLAHKTAQLTTELVQSALGKSIV